MPALTKVYLAAAGAGDGYPGAAGYRVDSLQPIVRSMVWPPACVRSGILGWDRVFPMPRPPEIGWR